MFLFMDSVVFILFFSKKHYDSRHDKLETENSSVITTHNQVKLRTHKVQGKQSDNVRKFCCQSNMLGPDPGYLRH